MNRTTFQFWMTIILLGTLLISSIPGYTTFASPLDPGTEVEDTEEDDQEEDDQEEKLTVEVQSQYPLEGFPPGEPFLLLFSEPMQEDSSTQPLVTVPFLDAQLVWSEDGKQLTFTPEGGFVFNQVYTISLDKALISQSGKQFDEPQSWELHTLAGPSIVSRSPEGLYISDRFPIIQVTFDRIMDGASVLEAIEVEPEIELEFGWGGKDFFIRSLTELDPNSVYRFSIGQETKDLHGLSLGSSYTWSYTLEPTLKNFTHPTPENRQTFIGVEFNYAVKWDSLEGNLSIEPETPGQWIQDEKRTNHILFIPDGNFESDVQYTIRFPDQLYDLRGSELPAPEPVSFQSPSAVRGTDTGDDESGDPPREIKIDFDRPMDEVATFEALSFNPPIHGQHYWRSEEFVDDENQYGDSPENAEAPVVTIHSLIFIPDQGSIAWGTEYTVTISTSAKDAEGKQVLSEPYQWSFQTGIPEDAYSGKFGFDGSNIQVIDVDGPRGVQFELHSDYEHDLDFSLHGLTLGQFLARYPENPLRAYWHASSTIDLSETSEVQRWTDENPASRDSVGETRIPNDVPPGIYVLNMIDTNYDVVVDQIFIVLSRNTLMVKEGNNQIVTWVTDINGGPQQGVLVQIYDMQGELIDSGTSDIVGVYRSRFSKEDEPYLVVARVGSDISVSGLDRSWKERESIWSWRSFSREEQKEYGINTYTDRPIYRPGQTVYFKSILRQDDDAVISLPYQGTPVLVRIRDSRDNLVQSYELSTNSFGTANGEFILSDGAMVGDYTIEVEALGKTIQQIFKVQDYKKPDIQTTLETDAEQYVDGEDIRLTLSADYFFGEPVRDADVSLWAYDLVPITWWHWNFEEDDQFYWTSGSSIHKGQLQIENGILEYSFPAEIDHYGTQQSYRSNIERRIVAIEANLHDDSGQSISTYKIVEIYSTNTEMTLDLGDYFKKPGQSFPVVASAFHISGEPLVEFPIQLKVYKYNRDTRKYDDVFLSTDLLTGEEGMVTENITLEQTGAYRFELVGKDDFGNELNYRRWAYVYQEGTPWVRDHDEEIRIFSSKTTYMPSETASLAIESTFDGEALLTVQRGTTRRVQRVYLTSPLTNVDLYIRETDSPNIFVTINAYKDEKSSIQELPDWEEYWAMESLVESKLHHDTIELTVPHQRKELTITLTPDKEIYQPREEATFSILVVDEVGNPVSAELSLALVDDAIFSLSDDLSSPLFDAFYASRKNAVRTYNSMGARRWIHLFGGAGGGGGGPDLPGTPRSDFPDTAAWIPVLRTDSSGRAELSILLPDSLTTWRLTAKAVTKDTKVGEAEIQILTKQDVVIRPMVPRSLTQGDEVILSAEVQNYTDHEREFSVLLMNTSFEVLDPAIQVLAVKADERGTVSWRVRSDHPGEAVFTIVADDGDIGDAIQVTIPVQQISIPEGTFQVGDFKGRLSTMIEISEENFDLSWVEIELSRSIADSLLTGLDYLTHFPYGCVEQTMSRALPNAMVARALNQLGIGTLPELGDLPKKINAGLQRLYGYQHLDGGWGWWHDDDSHPYQTAWVVYGLAMTLEAGYEVDPEVIQRGAEWLSREMDEMGEQMKAYALYSMAVAGYGELEPTLELVHEVDSLDSFSIAAIALALHEMGEHEPANDLIKILERHAVVDEGYVHWPVDDADGTYYRHMMSSEVRDTALVLSAFVKIAPDHAYETRIVRWLMDHRSVHGWGDTHQTSYAILALTDHLLSEKQNPIPTSYVVSLNGDEIAVGSLNAETPKTTIEFSSEQLLPGGNSIEITQQGAGRMYYTISSWSYTTEADVEAAGNITIKRNYQFLSGSRPNPDSRLGQLVKVTLEITMPKDGSFIILEDKLPGGFEALNESLSITSHEVNIWAEPRFAWKSNGYNHKEIRADRVSFFFTELSAGIHTYTYVARVNYLGEFTAMPTQAWAMYDNKLWGRSASDRVVVDE
jgi:uncharacterized protein YfaS (alpha-2-macroglobulin family)